MSVFIYDKPFLHVNDCQILFKYIYKMLQRLQLQISQLVYCVLISICFIIICLDVKMGDNNETNKKGLHF